MKLLVTGAKGFVGRNLIATLETIRDGRNKCYPLLSDIEILPYDIDTDPALLDAYCASCDFVFHLAGVNRPKDVSEFMSGNFGFTSILLDTLKRHGNKAPVLISSSIQAALDNPYGQSKKAGEDLMFSYSKEIGALVFVFRLPNVFVAFDILKLPRYCCPFVPKEWKIFHGCIRGGFCGTFTRILDLKFLLSSCFPQS